MKSNRPCVLCLLLALAGLLAAGRVWAQSSNVVVAFTTTNATPLNLGYCGFTSELLGKGIEYADTNMQNLAATLSPGWILFPAGTTGDAFDWSSGLTRTDWVDVVVTNEGPNNPAGSLTEGTYLPLLGKGGAQFTNFAAMARNLGGAKIIVCVNGFTDDAASAGGFAAFASTNHIPVAVWELCNEPYLFFGTNQFFASGADYASKMKPYRDAIKAADPNAVVAVFFSDPARTGMSWNNGLATYTNQYWDAIVYHHYPELGTNLSFANLMALDNSVLYSNTTMFVTNTLMAKSSNYMTFLVTELDPNMGQGNGVQNPPTSTLYGGIFASEYVMRLSTIPRVIYAGSYQMVNGCGVDLTNDFGGAVDKAANHGYVTNTVGLPFGYFLSAQGSAEAVAYWALYRSTAVYPTSVGTNCPTVYMDTNGLTTMPAIYAQGYQGANGKRYLLLTNKGTNSLVLITQNGLQLTNQLLETYVTGSDPSVVNANPPFTNNVAILSAMVTNPVAIPQYSVARLEWPVFSVPKPMLSLSVSNAVQTLRWIGLTNVAYNVQATTNVLTSWSTLGRVTSTRTNFSFTNSNSGDRQYYRLLVP